MAFGPMGIPERWANNSLDAALIAAGRQGLLRVGKAIFASDQIVKTYSSRGSQSNCGRPRIGVAECAGNHQLALLDQPERQP